MFFVFILHLAIAFAVMFFLSQDMSLKSINNEDASSLYSYKTWLIILLFMSAGAFIKNFTDSTKYLSQDSSVKKTIAMLITSPKGKNRAAAFYISNLFLSFIINDLHIFLLLILTLFSGHYGVTLWVFIFIGMGFLGSLFGMFSMSTLANIQRTRNYIIVSVFCSIMVYLSVRLGRVAMPDIQFTEHQIQMVTLLWGCLLATSVPILILRMKSLFSKKLVLILEQQSQHLHSSTSQNHIQHKYAHLILIAKKYFRRKENVSMWATIMACQIIMILFVEDSFLVLLSIVTFSYMLMDDAQDAFLKEINDNTLTSPIQKDTLKEHILLTLLAPSYAVVFINTILCTILYGLSGVALILSVLCNLKTSMLVLKYQNKHEKALKRIESVKMLDWNEKLRIQITKIYFYIGTLFSIAILGSINIFVFAGVGLFYYVAHFFIILFLLMYIKEQLFDLKKLK